MKIKRIGTWNTKTCFSSPSLFEFSGAKIKGSLVVSPGSSSLSPWHLGAGPAQSQNGCSFVPQRWQTYCIALCTRQTAGSCRAEFKGRPAQAPSADWLYARLVTAGQQRRPSGRPRPVTSGASPPKQRTRWRWAACAALALPLRLSSHPAAGRGKGREGRGHLVGAFRWRQLPETISLLAVLFAFPSSRPHPWHVVF